MGTVTLGVSIAVPEPHGSRLQELRAGFGDAAAHGIPTHVTLVPPTEVEADRLPEIRAHLTEVAARFPAFPMRLSGTGTFRPVSPVVFVRIAEGTEGCTRLQGEVRDPAGPLSRELAFPYHPHVTVAHGISEEAMDVAFATLADYAAEWVCEGFALYEQGSDGVWRKLREYPFGSGPIGVPAQPGSPVDQTAEAAGTPRRPS
ncbi:MULTISPECIES: 2'-5' RNA ligase family protein [Streptomyces]|uniref:Phosphoesterase n=1 Tax=Streptomyces amritsarensis TaxID=681158 RepID=A0ABX3FYU3_9ACTN|nr:MULTISPECIES: 2'-5' RNA ligase family protein [Streptomyces]AQT74045.1 phosphoesterase [Streptomyces sp. fd1-xmd]MDX6760401.1 2'-5' RNA ligase family protein [Streptomyces sp. F8]OLZ57972.1 phosphoesterase [Streptomyces amritsarensis]